MSIYGDPPHVDGLNELRAFMATRDIEVRQDYEPGVELEDGTWVEGGWVIRLVKTTLMDDGRIWLAASEISEEAVAWAEFSAWKLIAELLEENRPGGRPLPA